MACLGVKCGSEDGGVPVTDVTISAYSSRQFVALARVLGVSMEALFYGEEAAARIAAERESDGAGTPTDRG